MSIKILLSTLSVLGVLVVNSQNVRLGVHNPSPRAGDIIEIEFTIPNDSLQTSSTNIDSLTSLNLNCLGKGSIIIKKIIANEGTYSIGPFSFVIDGKTYTSNKIQLNVAPKLPNDREGLWLREATFDNKDYLIIEQRIDLSNKNPKLKTPYDSFVELGDNLYDNSAISFSFVSSTSTQQTDIDQLNDPTNKIIYKRQVYKINKLSGFKGSYVLSQNDFTNVPKNVTFSGLIIK